MPDKAPAVRHRVLIVDDEESTRLLLAKLLTRDVGVEAVLAGTCEQALRLAGNYAYDCILLDLMMPGVGGVEVLKRIRASSPNESTPVVVVSVLSDKATVDRCMAEGASAYLVKPVERHALATTVRAQMAARRKSRKTNRKDD